MEVQSRPDFATGIRVARFVSSIVRDASTAGLLADAAQTSRQIAQTAAAVAHSRQHGVPRVTQSPATFDIPFWQWEEQNNRRFIDPTGVNRSASTQPGPAPAPISPRASEAQAIAYKVRAAIQDSFARGTAPRIGDVSAVNAQPPLRRIDVITIQRTFGPAGNLVDLIA